MRPKVATSGRTATPPMEPTKIADRSWLITTSWNVFGAAQFPPVLWLVVTAPVAVQVRLIWPQFGPSTSNVALPCDHVTGASGKKKSKQPSGPETNRFPTLLAFRLTTSTRTSKPTKKTPDSKACPNLKFRLVSSAPAGAAKASITAIASGDFDGDGTTTVAVHREATGLVYLRNDLQTGPAQLEFFYGTAADRIVAGDWDNDGDQTVGVFRPSATRFFLSNANRTAPADIEFIFGQSDWLPFAGAD